MPPRRGQRWLTARRENLWLRALLVHPAGFVAPWVALCLVLAARPGSDIGDVSFGFAAVPLGALAGFVATAVMVARRPLSAAERGVLLAYGLLAGAAALVLGFYGWGLAANVACHGGYECPF